LTSSFIYETPFGSVTIVDDDGAVAACHFGQRLEGKLTETPLLRRAGIEIDEYFTGTRRSFDIPLRYMGSAFTRAVWKAVAEIPYGETRSYGQIALAAGYFRAARAVGTAMRECPIAIFIPCHRVIHADGSLGGFGDPALKRDLLALEGISLRRR